MNVYKTVTIVFVHTYKLAEVEWPPVWDGHLFVQTEQHLQAPHK